MVIRTFLTPEGLFQTSELLSVKEIVSVKLYERLSDWTGNLKLFKCPLPLGRCTRVWLNYSHLIQFHINPSPSRTECCDALCFTLLISAYL